MAARRAWFSSHLRGIGEEANPRVSSEVSQIWAWRRKCKRMNETCMSREYISVLFSFCVGGVCVSRLAHPPHPPIPLTAFRHDFSKNQSVFEAPTCSHGACETPSAP